VSLPCVDDFLSGVGPEAVVAVELLVKAALRLSKLSLAAMELPDGGVVDDWFGMGAADGIAGLHRVELSTALLFN